MTTNTNEDHNKTSVKLDIIEVYLPEDVMKETKQEKLYVEAKLINNIKKSAIEDIKHITKDELGNDILKFQEVFLFSNPDVKLSDIYRQKIEIYLRNASNDNVIARKKIPIQRLMIGQKILKRFDMESVDNSTSSGRNVNAEINHTYYITLGILVKAPMRLWAGFMNDTLLTYVNTMSKQQANFTSDSFEISNAMVVPFVISMMIALFCVSIGAPFLLPFVIIFVKITFVLLFISVTVLSSTKVGKDFLLKTFDPLLSKLTQTQVGQQLVFQTGPLPEKKKIIKLFCPHGKWGRLGLCLAIDFIGSSSLLDKKNKKINWVTKFIWALLVSYILHIMYQNAGNTAPYAPHILFLVDLVKILPVTYFILHVYTGKVPYAKYIEKILPFIDRIPTATMIWMYRYRELFYMCTREQFYPGA